MINRVRKGRQLPKSDGISGGFIIDEVSERIKASVSSKESDPRYVEARGFETKDANYTITSKDAGKTFVHAHASASVIATLPKAATSNKGMRLAFIVNSLPSAGTGHAVSPNAADKFVGNGYTPAVDKDAVCIVASDRLGDRLEVESNGVDTWFITGVIGTWNREA
jgi:hypothetical protein